MSKGHRPYQRQGYSRARVTTKVSVGRSLAILREFQGLTQTELSARSGLPQSTISALERDRIALGVERAKVLARALKCHPAVLAFPGWDVEAESKKVA